MNTSHHNPSCFPHQNHCHPKSNSRGYIPFTLDIVGAITVVINWISRALDTGTAANPHNVEIAERKEFERLRHNTPVCYVTKVSLHNHNSDDKGVVTPEWSGSVCGALRAWLNSIVHHKPHTLDWPQPRAHWPLCGPGTPSERWLSIVLLSIAKKGFLSIICKLLDTVVEVADPVSTFIKMNSHCAATWLTNLYSSGTPRGTRITPT